MSKIKNKSFNSPFNTKRKKLAFGAILAVVIVAGAAILATSINIPALRGFKNISYTNNKGTTYTVDFYAAHTSMQLETGNTQLVSKVSRDGKFPISLSITNGEDTSALNVNGIRGCTGPLLKAFDVRNNNLNQTMSVCYLPKDNGLVSPYIIGFEHGGKAHIVTIGQDLSGLNLTSPSGARKSIPKFGIEPYRSDIERIVSSISVQ